MLPKKLRLSWIEAHLLAKKSKKAESLYFRLFYQKDDTSNFQWFIRVPKRIVKKATSRNRIKRIIHEAIWQLNPKIKTSGKAVISVVKNTGDLKTQDVLLLLNEMLKKEEITS